MRYSHPPYISWMVFHIVGFFLHERKGRGEMRSPRVLWEREWRGASKHYEGKFFFTFLTCVWGIWKRKMYPKNKTMSFPHKKIMKEIFIQYVGLFIMKTPIQHPLFCIPHPSFLCKKRNNAIHFIIFHQQEYTQLTKVGNPNSALRKTSFNDSFLKKVRIRWFLCYSCFHRLIMSVWGKERINIVKETFPIFIYSRKLELLFFWIMKYTILYGRESLWHNITSILSPDVNKKKANKWR